MTAESMMRDQAAAGLYAPLRVVSYREPSAGLRELVKELG
jgi:hypothetical protein